VLESTFTVESLFPRREHEFLAAIAAFDYLVDIRHGASETLSPLKTKSPPAGETGRGSDGQQSREPGGAFGDLNRGEESLHSTRCFRDSRGAAVLWSTLSEW